VFILNTTADLPCKANHTCSTCAVERYAEGAGAGSRTTV